MKTVGDFSAYLCRLGMPIRETLARIDSTEQLFQLVVDEDGRLLGTITDGDIRRAMLSGVALEDRAECCMHRDPVIGRAGDTETNALRLMTLGSSRPFLPIVDEDGRVVDVLVRHRGDAGIAEAVVMAGGFGTRLGVLTQSRPKPLLEVGGKPLLERVLSWLETGGVERATVAVHHLAEQIESYLTDRTGKLRVSLIREESPLGTAGVLGHLEHQKEPVAVVNADVLTEFDLRQMAEFHASHGNDGTIAAATHEVRVPFGVIRHREDGSFLGMDEKPVMRQLVAAGVYMISPSVLGLVQRNLPMEMPDLLNLARSVGLQIGVFPVHEYWRDIGRQEDLEAARSEFGMEPRDVTSATPSA